MLTQDLLTIVFDLDGTLIDTAPDLISTLNLILAREGMPAVAYDEARKMIGGGARGMIERALIAEGRDNSKPEFKPELDRMFGAFIDHYAAHIADHSRPFPELETALDGLAADNYRLAVCTNKLEWLSVRLLDTLDLSKRFAAICGQDTFGMQKPDPEVLRRTILKAGGAPDRAIMVGDSGTDVRTARAAALPVIAVTFGYSEVPIESLRPDRLIGSYSELEAAIRGIEATAR
jgi:phosphoglycolate phosphatase